MVSTLLSVALGGALGASARYLTVVAAVRLLGHGFPWGTLVVNVIGSLCMGALFVALTQFSATRFSPFLLTGVLGGFTTFSAFSLDAVTLVQRGALSEAVAYVAGSVVVCLAALWAGMVLARGILT